ATRFRSGAYVVFMCIAWTALFHAIFFKRKIKPFYRDPQHARRYQKREGDYQAWELAECIRQYYGFNNPPVRRNLEFFIPLRNKIEHRSMPELDIEIFGECQALLFNFEDILSQEFNSSCLLNESLTLSLQFSQFRNQYKDKAIARLHQPLTKNIKNYIDKFRSSLSTEELNNLEFSYKVFIVPKLANHESRDTLAVEFIKYDPANPDDMEKYERIVTLMKINQIAVANPGRLKPGDVCKVIEPIVKKVAGSDKKFVPSSHHVRACYFYKIRPRKDEGDPRKTNPKYCHYDEAHKDYVYTKEWLEFLKSEMGTPRQYEKVMQSR
ncbi:MAG: DUF3644 domain-containing protein, partial [Leptolyngbya sp. SIO4C5]|nr:DUF3644 domain-containing protein [Leptolyngbya sp. SIO4C5]